MRQDENPIPLHQLATGQVQVIKAANGSIISARISRRYLYEILLERDLITEWQVRCAHAYMAMKNGFAGRSGYKTLRLALEDIYPTEGVPTGEMEKVYLFVMRGLGKQRSEAIAHAMENYSSGHTINHTLFPAIFQRLEGLFDLAHKKLDNNIKQA